MNRYRNMKKRIFGLILAFVMFVSIMPFFPLKTYAMGGSGTASNPYLIYNQTDLNSVINNMSAYYKLMNNISVTNFVTIGDNGSGQTQFTGYFDGNNYTISGTVLMNTNPNPMASIFASIGSGGTVKNLNTSLTVSLNSTSGVPYDLYAAGIAGMNKGIIDNCSTVMNYSVVANHSSAYYVGCIYLGGVAGVNSGVIRNCTSSGTSYSYYNYVGNNNNHGYLSIYNGGIAGNNSGTIYNCYTTAGKTESNVTMNSSCAMVYQANMKAYAGRIAGINNGTISACYATGTAVAYATSYYPSNGTANAYYGQIRGSGNGYTSCYANWDSSYAATLNDWVVSKGTNYRLWTTSGTFTDYYGKGYALSGSSTNSTYGYVTGSGSYTYNTSVTLAAYACTGYRFVKWNDGITTQTRTIIMPMQALSYTATFEPVTYQITYQNCDGVTNGNTTSYTIQTSTITLQNVTKTGYTFGGWYADSSYQTAVSQISKGSYGNKTFYAKWNPISYPIAYQNCDGVTNANPTSYTIQTNTITLQSLTKTGYSFGGWYTNSNYQTTATQIAQGSYGNKTFYAKWNPISYQITYQNCDGVVNTNLTGYTIQTNTITLQSLTKTGYSFGGWYTDSNYQSAVTQIPKGSYGNKAFYAKWIPNQSTLTVELNGGKWSQDAAETIQNHTTFTQEYGTVLSLPYPEYEGKTFQGWSIESNSNGSLTPNLRDSYTYTFGPDTTAVTITAIWNENQNTRVENSSQSFPKVQADQLDQTFKQTVEESDKGVTEGDLTAGSVELVLSVKDATENMPGVGNIEEEASNLTPYYFDVSVIKKVTQAGSTESSEVTLSELPYPVKIVMDMTGTELEGKASYQVYRYHEGTVQQLQSGSIDGEYYMVNGNIITIYTRKFSIYAITAGETSLTVDTSNGGTDHMALDVQGKVTEGTDPVYKLDINWGAMKFEYGIAESEWNPESHQYETAGEAAKDAGWLRSGFLDGNNKIIITNHSNADIRFSCAVTGNSNVKGTEMTMRQTNEETGTLAENVSLQKVPMTGAAAPWQEVFLRMTGTPEDVSLLKNETYAKVGVITVTIESAGGELTPCGSQE